MQKFGQRRLCDPHPPEEAGEDVHGSEEDEDQLEQAHARWADVEPLREDAGVCVCVCVCVCVSQYFVPRSNGPTGCTSEKPPPPPPSSADK